MSNTRVELTDIKFSVLNKKLVQYAALMDVKPFQCDMYIKSTNNNLVEYQDGRVKTSPNPIFNRYSAFKVDTTLTINERHLTAYIDGEWVKVSSESPEDRFEVTFDTKY